MTLCEELYFEITISGTRSDLKKFVSYLKSGELDEFFEIENDFIDYDDNFEDCDDNDETYITFSNDDFGIEIDEFDSGEFLEVFCRAGKNLDMRGRLYDIDDEEYSFISSKGDSYYLNAKNVHLNDELDEEARKEDDFED